MRIGIFFGGSSREREISFAGGRTVYDNLDKNLFDAVPIFVDSFGNDELKGFHGKYAPARMRIKVKGFERMDARRY